MSKIAKFFNKVSNNILRDFYEILTIANKEKFAKRTIEEFNKQKESIEENTGIEIFFDGIVNFKKGLKLFSLSAICENEIVVYDMFTSAYYWGSSEEFYINQIRCKNDFSDNAERAILSDVIPDTLKIAWFLSGGINKFSLHDNEKYSELLSNVKNENNIYSR